VAKWRVENEEKSAYQELEAIRLNRKKRYNFEIQKGNRRKPNPDYDIIFEQNEDIPSWASADLNNLIDINAGIGWRGLTKKEYTKERNYQKN